MNFVNISKIPKYTTRFIVNNSVQYILPDAFSETRDYIQEVVFNSENLVAIEKNAFTLCYKIKTIDLTKCKSLIRLGNYSFSSCVNLEHITINKELKYIGDRAFFDCHKLTSVYIPENNSLEYFGYAIDLFRNYEYIIPEHLSFLGGIEKFQYNKFTIHPKNTHFFVHDSCLYSNKTKLLYKCYYNTTEIVIPEGIEGATHYACSFLYSLQSVVFPKSFITAYTESFQNTSIKYLNLSHCTELKEIDYSAFYECTELEYVDIRNTKVTSLSTTAFKNNIKLTTFYFNSLLETIYDGVFEGCINLKNFIYPNNSVLTRIAGNALHDTNITNLEFGPSFQSFFKFPPSKTKIQQLTVSKDNKNCVVEENVLFTADKTILIWYLINKPEKHYDIPSTVKTISAGAFMNAQNLESVYIPNSVQILSIACFKCSMLKSINIPDSVTELWEHSFESCEQLISLKIGRNVKRILRYSFNECKSLTYINILANNALIKDHVFTGCNFIRCVNGPNSILKRMEIYAPKSTFSETKCPIQKNKLRIFVE